MTTLTTLIRRIESHRYDRGAIIEAAASNTIGKLAWHALSHERDDEALHELPGWPECECTACGCSEPATTTDDGGCAVCAECAEYTVDDDGDVHCMRCGDVEIVTESCGAGNQTRSYARLIPPEMPESDPEGEWACYWDTVGDDAHVISRHATRESAEQAVAAHDWPRPGDRTAYLCGYVVRQLVGGEWTQPEQE